MHDFFISLLLLGAMSSSDGYLPYWATTNQYGIMPERNGGLSLIQAQSKFDDEKTLQWRWGTSLAINEYNNPLDKGSGLVHSMIDQLYGSLRWKMFTMDLGIKHRENEFLGSSRNLGSLSATGGHLVESGNARSMPGYLFTMEPVVVPFTGGRFLLSGAYGDYATTDNRLVKGALVHRMRIGFHLEPFERLSLSATLDHYALWAGTHPDPEKAQTAITLNNYLRVITGSHAGAGGTLGDRVNVIGDHGGSEIFKAVYRGDGWTFTVQHDIPYADGSGMGFQNFPDGVNTLHFGLAEKNRWISDILYEQQYTMFQSGTYNQEQFDDDGNNINPPGVQTTGGDNYFGNSYYRSGWTHHGYTIGDPLILPTGKHDGTWSSVLANPRMENTRLKSHHFALGGKLFKIHPYKLMLTYSENYGTYRNPYCGESQWHKPWGTVKEKGLKQLSAALLGEMNIHQQKSTTRLGFGGRVSGLYGLFIDKGQLYEDTAGIILGVRYTISEVTRNN